MNLNLIYCYDAYCGWCYGFSKVMNQVEKNFANQFNFEVLSGGMILPEKPIHINATADYIKENYKIVEEYSDIKFGQDYLWHINNPDLSDWFPNSLKPAIALSIFKEQYPEKQIEFITDLQQALYFEGRDLTDDEAYRFILIKYNINEEDFYLKLKSEEFKHKAEYDFALCKQLKITGFPTLLIQSSETKLYLVSRGFSSYQDVKSRIENILKEISLANN